MSVDTAFERFLERYGQSVTVHYQDEPLGVPCHAFVQPARERKARELPTVLGAVRQDKWLYLGDPGVPLEGLGDGYVVWRGRRFDVLTAQAVYIGSELSHWWAVLTPRDGEMTE